MDTSSITIKQLVGAEAVPHIPDLARLRIQVFREYPYLYDGDEQYEVRHLHNYSKSGEATIVLAIDNGKIIGASTGIPVEDDHDTYKKPFIENGYDLSKVFYFGESVLLPEYRGLGLYKHFMTGREAYAKSTGRFDLCCFCAVVRPENHPLKPAEQTPMEQIWPRYGFTKRRELVTYMPWKDIDKNETDKKPMVFWTKAI